MKIFHIIALAIMLVGFSSLAQAQTSIAVVDVQMLLTESKAAKHIQKQIQKHREMFLEQLSKEEQLLKKTEKELVEKKADTPPEEFAKERKAFEEKFLETRRLAQKKKRTLDGATVKAMAKLERTLYTVVQEVADEKSYDLVLSRQSVVLGEKSLDISEEVMKKLNDTVSKINLDLSAK